MKKISKLQLNKETIAKLNSKEAESIHGGEVFGCTYWDDWSCRFSVANCMTVANCPEPPVPISGHAGCANYTQIDGGCFSKGLSLCGPC